MRGRRAALALLVAASTTIGCEASTDPSKGEREVRLEAVTPTDLVGVEWVQIEPVPRVRVLDLDGSPAAGVLVYFEIERGSGVVGNPGAISTSDGTASVGMWSVSSEGTRTLTARSGESRVTFTAVVEAWRAIDRVTGDGQTAAPDQVLPLHLVVLVTMDEGWPVSGAEVTYTVVSGGGSIEGGVTVTDSEGHAESGAWTLGPEVGTQEVRVESGSASIVFVAYANEPAGAQDEEE